MVKMQPPRGAHDFFGVSADLYNHIVETGSRVLGLAGFGEWKTPIFENTAVFSRTLGESSDVVSKEMYTFNDRGGNSLTLRPEGTAPICRALVSNSLTQELPQRVYYHGPMFRYERPQKGRFRQFHQFGAEYIGVEGAWRDAEMIALGASFLKELGLADEVRLEINTLGDGKSRARWREALTEYFTKSQGDLSEESRQRLHLNPLRILDSKDEIDRQIVGDAPRFCDYLTEESREFWDELRKTLAALEVEYTENPRIVRGLDYYSHTAFEFVTDRLGAQGTVLAGGRYEGLIEEMGGPAIPAIGWAAGIERLCELCSLPKRSVRKVAVLPIDEDLIVPALKTAMYFRREVGVEVSVETKGSLKKRLERADKAGCSGVAIFSLREDGGWRIQLRDLKSRERLEDNADDMTFGDVVAFLTGDMGSS